METNRHTSTDTLVRVPRDLHTQAKAAAALDRMSLRELVSVLLREWLSSRKAA